MIVFAVATAAVLLLAGLAYHMWCEVRWERERTRLVNLATARTPSDFAVLQRASTLTDPSPEAGPAKPKAAPIEGSF